MLRRNFWFDSARVLLFVAAFAVLTYWLEFASPEAVKARVNFAEPVKAIRLPKTTQRQIDPLKIQAPKLSISSQFNEQNTTELAFQNTINDSTPAAAKSWPIENDGSIAWIRLDGRTKIQVPHFQLTEINLNQAFTLMIVFQGASFQWIGDLFSLGDCENNRFVAHLPYHGPKLLFQFGDPRAHPLQVSLSANPSPWHIMVLKRDGSVVTLILDDQVYEYHDAWEPLQKKTYDLEIGNSPCGNSFVGKLGEFIYFNTALNLNKVEESINSLRHKFNSPSD